MTEERVVETAKRPVESPRFLDGFPNRDLHSRLGRSCFQRGSRAVVSFSGIRRQDEQFRHAAEDYRTGATVLHRQADNVGVGTYWPRLALVWMYSGKNQQDRREMIAGLDYPEVDIVVPDGTQSLDCIVDLVAPHADVWVFWADDDKPVGGDFLRQMAQPLVCDETYRAAMHLWAGNAIAIPREALVQAREGNVQLIADSFMKLALGLLDVSSAPGTRTHVAFSSTERLAPLCADPVGRVC